MSDDDILKQRFIDAYRAWHEAVHGYKTFEDREKLFQAYVNARRAYLNEPFFLPSVFAIDEEANA